MIEQQLTLSDFIELLADTEKSGSVDEIKEVHKKFFSQKVTYEVIADLYDYADEVLTHEEGVDYLAKFIYNFQAYGNLLNWDWKTWETEKTKYYLERNDE
jgi:hypothetical protein